MSYAYTHLKHKTITDIRIFMHSYNELIQLLMLITDLCLFGYPVGHIFILISRRTHTYIDFLVCDTELIHIVILISRRTHTY